MLSAPDLEKAKSWLELLAKSAYVVFVASAFVLFVPNQAAKQIHIDSIRDDYLGWFWIVFIASSALLARHLFYTGVRLVSERTEAKRTGEKLKAAERKKQEVLEQRLGTLNNGERNWILYCLFHNIQTLYTRQDHRDAQSLINKRILVSGSGNIFNLPFHIQDNVWTYLLEHRRTYLPVEWETRSDFLAAMESFEQDLGNEFAYL